MKWDLEEFAYSNNESAKSTVESADQFVRNIPTFSQTTKAVTSVIRNRLINVYGLTRYQNKKLQLVIQTASLLRWSETLGICIDKEQEFDPKTLMTIADYAGHDFKLYITPPRAIIRAYFANPGDNQPIADYKISIQRNLLPKIVFTEGVFKTTNEHLPSINSLMQLIDLIGSALPVKANFL